jgi:hypothetical protein
MMGCRSNQSCRELFVKLGILPLTFQYIFSLLLFLNKNKNLFTVNSTIYQYATRQQSNFHQPSANLSKYQKGICYLGVKVFNKLPPYIKEEFDNSRKFKRSLQNFLSEKSFYSLQKYVKLNNVNIIMLYIHTKCTIIYHSQFHCLYC